MSYDLAVWEGERPVDDSAAAAMFEELAERYLESDDPIPPTERISAYVSKLLERWVDLGDDEEDTSPWSSGPLISEASGPFIYFPMRFSMADEASAYAAEVAKEMGLVCYDPQLEALRP